MAKVDEFPVKDEEQAHLVAEVWRPTFAAIVQAFVEGDFGLSRSISGVTPLSDAQSDHISQYITDYGETLVPLSDDTWRTSVAQWLGSGWDVLVDLETRESGVSDLVLHAHVVECDGTYRVEVGLVYVP